MIDQGALLSPDRVYRYRLWRVWRTDLPRLAFLMLNPSTADESWDDPTITRCIRRARRLGYGSIDIVNLYALRSPDPGMLWRHTDPVGADNDAHLEAVASAAAAIVCGWGSFPQARTRISQVLSGALRGRRLHVIRVNRDGNPAHPLYLPYATELAPWEPIERQFR